VQAAMARKHLFFGSLSEASRRDSLKWAPVREAISALDDGLEGLVEFLPDDWRSSGASVATHIHAVRAHLDAFESQLRGGLT